MRREFKKKSRILLIDDNYEHLVGVRELLSLEGSFDVVNASTSAAVGINMIKKYQPDVVLMDMNMPEKDGLQAIQEIRNLDLPVKIIALSAYDDADLIFRAMKLGARGICSTYLCNRRSSCRKNLPAVSFIFEILRILPKIC